MFKRIAVLTLFFGMVYGLFGVAVNDFKSDLEQAKVKKEIVYKDILSENVEK